MSAPPAPPSPPPIDRRRAPAARPEHIRAKHRRYRAGCDPVAWYVLGALAEYAGKDDVARISLGRIASENNLSRPTVKRAVRELIRLGYLKRGAPEGRLVPWVLLVDPLEIRQAKAVAGKPSTRVTGDPGKTKRTRVTGAPGDNPSPGSPATRVTSDPGQMEPSTRVTGDPSPGSPVTPLVAAVAAIVDKTTSSSGASAPPASATPPSAPPKRRHRGGCEAPQPDLPLDVAPIKAWHEESRRIATHQPKLPSRPITPEAIDAVRSWLSAGHTEAQMRALIDFANGDRQYHQQKSGNLTYVARNWDRILDDLRKRGKPQQKAAFETPREHDVSAAEGFGVAPLARHPSDA